jgi:hypothetical protein
MAQVKHPPGPPMTLANMNEQGVHHPIAYCHNDACRHQAVIRNADRVPMNERIWKSPAGESE